MQGPPDPPMAGFPAGEHPAWGRARENNPKSYQRRGDMSNTEIQKGAIIFCHSPSGTFCQHHLHHAGIFLKDRRKARRLATAAAFLCLQCIPACLHLAATVNLQADSIIPDPTKKPCLRSLP